ncbi:peptidylprolyl isomerase [Zwartia panacis]|jgi:peptidyl-prolyl cis-trans isomerase C|uniref:peptidylprolyl isomerase n=1 Tax=Zwartia panacis TaxID=2683345 RepID=UPI0025B4282F|nr:peptidylprolyl isomerase [Zwartia panacis]MDN4015476.1 peptidylprolyl isomerase [Zwartia panacis]
MMNIRLLKSSAICAAFLLMSGMAHAQPKPAAPLATVNGVAIPESLLEQNVRANVAQGQRDTPELRQVLKDELINREILSQEAAKLGLDKTAEAKTQLAQLRQTMMVELLLNDYAKKNPITDVKIKAEYDRRVELLKNEQEYKVGLIVTQTEDEAKSILARLNKGESFAKLAEQSSIDPSKVRGGDVGWVLPAQILPAISNVMVNLNKGSLAVAPIRTQAGWNIIKVEDKRAYQAPSLNDAKNEIRQSLAQQQRAELVKRLRDSAKVQ